MIGSAKSIGHIDNIAGPPEADQLNFSNHSFIQYFKSALTAYYINELLIENSNGTKDINDFMKLLFSNFATQGTQINKQGFINTLNTLTDYDFTDVVNDYLYGTERLNLDGYFQ